MRLKIVVCGGLLLAASAMAQDAKPPALLAKGENGSSTPLRVDEVDVEVNVVGNTAETVMTLRFRNDTDRILEGELVFPMGEGRTVSRYALEIEGRMREGVAVPKNRGRAVFESIVRRGIDPGLLEWTKGNNFRTRIYPIPANGTKSVRIGYEEELRNDGDSYLYKLPLAFAEKLDRFRLRVEAARPGADGEGIRIEGNLQPKNPNNQAWIIETEEKDYLANKPLTIRIPREKGNSVAIEERDGELYFHLLDRPEIPANRQAFAKPRTVHLVWDASLSGAHRDTAREQALIGDFLAWVGDASVRLTLLRNDLEGGGTFPVKAGKCPDLMAKLSAVAYDGGTRLGLLDFREMNEDLVVLVSDGVSTLGDARPAPREGPVVVLHAAESAEHGLLRSLAEQSGAPYLNLGSMSSEEALRLLTESPFSLLRITAEKAEAVSEVYPSKPTPVQGEIGIAGKLKDSTPVTLSLHYGAGGRVTHVRKVTLDPAQHRTQLGRVPRLWAQRKLAELEVDDKANRRRIIELGKAHSLVTRHTSLIVLDRIEDYVDFRIVPPEEKMRKEYERLLKDAPDPERPDPQHMENLLVAWKKMQRWHGKDFPGLDKALFKQVKELRPALKRIKAIQKDAPGGDDGPDAEERQALATLIQDMERLIKMVGQIEDVAENERGEEWNEALQDVSRGLQDLHAQAADLGLQEEDGGDDPFGGEADGGGLLGRSLNAVGALFGASANAESAPAAVAPSAVASEDGYDPPELPNSVGGTGGAVFPVTPATPTEFDVDSVSANIVTGGLRSGDAAITRNSIDAILNNPDRTATGGEDADPFAAPSDEEEEEADEIPGPPTEPVPQKPQEPDPPRPYLAALRAAKDQAELGKVYAEWKEKEEGPKAVAFLLDASDEFLAEKDRTMALRALTSLAELAPENIPLLRVLGHRLDQLGELELAEAVFREVHSLRDEEPQSWRDLALVLEKRGQHQEALGLLWTAIMQEWDGRFGPVQLILLNELNALLSRHGEGLDLTGIDKRFVYNLDCDLRIVLTWDADATDVDLWVSDPASETCTYEHNRTITGGRLSEDLTNGYGPEEFMIRKALPGKYQVKAHFYGNNRQDLTGSTTIQAVLIRDWGRPGEKRDAVTLRLRSEDEVVAIGEISFPPEPKKAGE